MGALPHKFDPSHADRLLAEERRQWQDPNQILSLLGLGPGEVLVDVGAGPGYFSVAAAPLVGPAGKVYAIDISLEMLMKLGQQIYAAGITNVEPVLSRETNIPLDGGIADAALLANVLHEAEDPGALLTEVRRMVKGGGRLLVVEWKKEPTPMGPPVEERLDPAALMSLAPAAGWQVEAAPDPGPYHWAVLLRTEG